jgi:hypothetical protein
MTTTANAAVTTTITAMAAIAVMTITTNRTQARPAKS